jgi:hypothetical protein
MTKICSKCGALKDLEQEFSVDKHSKTGRTSECKSCRKMRENRAYRNKVMSRPKEQE